MGRQTFFKRNFLLAINLWLLVENAYASNVSFSANQKRSYVGRVVINIESERQMMGTSDWYFFGPLFTIPIPQSLRQTNQSRLNFTANLGELETYSLSRIDIAAYRYSLTSTDLQFSVNTMNSNLIKKLTISYLVYRIQSQNSIFQVSQFYKYISFDGVKISSDPTTFLYYFTNISQPVSSFNQYNTLVMISGISVIYNIYNIYDISFSSTLINSTQTQTVIQSKSSQYTYLFQFICTIFIYVNPASQNRYHYYHGQFRAASGNYKALTNANANQMTSINTLVGLTSLFLYFQSEISFFVSVNETMGIVVTQTGYFSNANSLGFSYLVIYSNYCDYKTPYLQQVSQICYSQCPLKTTPNKSSLSCQCIINGTIINNNSQCLQKTQNGASSTPSSSSIGIIIGAVVSVAVLILVIVIIYKCCRAKKASIKSKELSQVNQRFNPQQQPPAIHQSSLSKQYIYQETIRAQQQLSVKVIQKVEWIVSQKQYFRESTCCACLEEKAFLQSSCLHSFHLSHLIQWVKGARGKDTCPLCREVFKSEFRYYCNVCCRRYRIVRLDQDINQNKFERICAKCRL